MNTGHPIACGDDCPQCAATTPLPRRCPQCGFELRATPCPLCELSRREHLRAWLDREPPREASPFSKWWREWFVLDEYRPWRNEYLGERSARVGPDDVGAVQRCGCEQCRPTEEEKVT